MPDPVSGTDSSAGPGDGGLNSPREIAAAVESLGVAKARADAQTLFALAVLAGSFISLGFVFATFAGAGSTLGPGPTRVLAGGVFSMGLVLVVLAGAELFTGNNLIAMAWASRLVTTREVIRNWAIVYAGNVAGCAATAALVAGSGVFDAGDGVAGRSVAAAAAAKAALPVGEAFCRGILCNALVCLAVWVAMASRSAGGKIAAVVLPVAAFVACGFEHSIANWFIFSAAAFCGDPAAPAASGAFRNLGAVTAGNVVGGTLLVAAVYWFAYLRSQRRTGGT